MSRRGRRGRKCTKGRALGWFGILDDRDDVALVAEALSCPRPQAERVLTAAERRGLVTPTAAKNQWKTTPLGWQLAVHWKPPSRIEPAIALDDHEDSKAINEIFDDVPCSILRAPDDGDAFEEAQLGVGVFVEYESPRVIEISVSIPDDDHPESSANIESSVYIGVDDAKRFSKALETAIKRAESEVARRPKLKTRKKRAGRAASASEEKQGGAEGTVVLKRGAGGAPSPAAIARAAAKAEAGADAAKRKEERAAEKKRKDEQRPGCDAQGAPRSRQTRQERGASVAPPFTGRVRLSSVLGSRKWLEFDEFRYVTLHARARHRMFSSENRKRS